MKPIHEMTLREIDENEMEHEAILWIATGLEEGAQDALSPGDPGHEEVTEIVGDLRRVAARMKEFFGISN